ncbi:hypothetical protein BC826DRAFT_1020423 [Russula brevipes]|nr:hypothetical protein BC826DRAFT_1020423 [Russula brevipes]
MRALVLPAEWTLFTQHIRASVILFNSWILSYWLPGHYSLLAHSSIRYVCNSIAHLLVKNEEKECLDQFLTPRHVISRVLVLT